MDTFLASGWAPSSEAGEASAAAVDGVPPKRLRQSPKTPPVPPPWRLMQQYQQQKQQQQQEQHAETDEQLAQRVYDHQVAKQRREQMRQIEDLQHVKILNLWKGLRIIHSL